MVKEIWGKYLRMELNHRMPLKPVDRLASCFQCHSCAIHVLTWFTQEAEVGH